MTRSERRLLARNAILGMILTATVTIVGTTGTLDAPESYFYDMRARLCQFFTPPPTDRLVHLDIDDPSLETIGRWPWSRSKMAEIVDEIRIAGAKALAMDIIFSEPELPSYEEVRQSEPAPSTLPSTLPASSPVVSARRIEGDDVFAAALTRFGKAVVPVSLNLSVRQVNSEIYQATVQELFREPQLERDQVIERLRAAGRTQLGLRDEVYAGFLDARGEAMYRRIASETKGDNSSFQELRARILPAIDSQIVGHPLLQILSDQYARFQAIQSLRRFGRPVPSNLPPLMTTRTEQATLRKFSQAAASTGFVDYIPLADGTVRNVPLFANHRDFLFPHMGLSLACAMLDIDIKDIRLDSTHIIIPRKDGAQIVIPVHTIETPRSRYGMFVDIPWFGRSGTSADDWQTMYDYPARQKFKQHMPMHFIWEACELRHRIARNNANIDDALKLLLFFVGPEELQAFEKNPPDVNDPDIRAPLVAATLKESRLIGVIEELQKDKPENLTAEERRLLASYKAVAQISEQTRGLRSNLIQRRAEIRAQLQGRAVLVGYIAVGAVADVVPTSLHARCPGVVVHGVIFNSIMNGEFWYRTPAWVTAAITVAMGILATLISGRLAAWKALTLSIVLNGSYLIVNGIYLFDYRNLIVGVAGPITVVIVVWAGGTLLRYLLEATERARVERRFRNYVDPGLVSYLLETENARLDGQEKEITVVFTDLANFTRISEQLKEKTVSLLNEYMGLMVPIIRRHGHLNKFLGDGIMYFYNAPRDNPDHAVHAIQSVLEMQDVMVSFNQRLAERGLPSLFVRAGVSAGAMVVGDAGPADGSASDYTVLGDTVNLGARLESANKAFDSRILCNARVRELAGDCALFRPIGKLQVKGKLEGAMTYEPLCLADRVTDALRQQAENTTEMVESFMARQFEKCLRTIERIEQTLGITKLEKYYRELCVQYIHEPPGPAFDGQIVLTEK